LIGLFSFAPDVHLVDWFVQFSVFKLCCIWFNISSHCFSYVEVICKSNF